MLVKLFFLTFLLIIQAINSFNTNKFCYLSDHKNLLCKNYQCGSNICTIDKQSCNQLEIWSNIIDKYMPKLNEKRLGAFYSFFTEINECKMNDYINLKTIVCSNKVKCNRENQSFFRYMIGLKPEECFCSGILKYDCGKDICSVNKAICDQMTNFNSKYKNLFESKIRKCF
jgi:hypothetical protein